MEEAEKLKEENQRLQKQLIAVQELHNIQNEPYFRKQMIKYLKRIAETLEKGINNS